MRVGETWTYYVASLPDLHESQVPLNNDHGLDIFAWLVNSGCPKESIGEDRAMISRKIQREPIRLSAYLPAFYLGIPSAPAYRRQGKKYLDASGFFAKINCQYNSPYSALKYGSQSLEPSTSENFP